MHTTALVRDERVTLCGWFRYPRLSPMVRMVLLAGLAALTLGGGAAGPDVRSGWLERVGSWPGVTRGPAASVGLLERHALVAIGEGGLSVTTSPKRSQPPSSVS